MTLPSLSNRLALASFLHKNPSAHVTIMTGAGQPPSQDAPAETDTFPLAALPNGAPVQADHAAFQPPLPTLPAPSVVTDATATPAATKPKRKGRLDDAARQRRHEAQQRILQAKRRFLQQTAQPDPNARDAQDRDIADQETMGGKLAVRIARQAIRDGRPIPRKPDGTVDICQARRDRGDQLAYQFRMPGTDEYPFRRRGKDGQWHGDRNAYAAYLARQRAKHVTDEQGRPRFYDPATGEVDMKAYRQMRVDRLSQGHG